MIKINKSPVSTSQNYGINNFDFDEIITSKNDDIKAIVTPKIQDETKYQNIEKLSANTCDFNDMENKISDFHNKETQENCNFKREYVFDTNYQSNTPYILEFDFDKYHTLVNQIKFRVKKDVDTKIIIRYNNETKYQNSCLKFDLAENSNVSVVLFSNINSSNASLFSVDIEQFDNSNLNFCVVDFASKNLVQNIHCRQNGENANINLSSLYFGKEDERLSLNYLVEIFAKRCTAKMNVFGVLDDFAKKNFVGTIDFKKGSKKSVGDESESCLLLSNDAKSNSAPILLSAEEDVDGKHSFSVGKVDDSVLFYAMTRGLDRADALQFYVNSKIKDITENVFDDKLKSEILSQISKRITNKND